MFGFTIPPSAKNYLRSLFCIAVFLAVGHANSQNTDLHKHKVPSDALERAKAGHSQDLDVVLENKEIKIRERRERESRGLQFNNSEIQENTAEEYKQLKNQVFPDGRLGDAHVVSDHKHVPLVFVRVPNLKSLERILSDPRVISVEAKQVFEPARSRSFLPNK